MNARIKLLRLLIITLYVFIISVNAYSQKDSVWVILTYTNKISDGKRTGQKTVTSQKTYSLDWKLIREMNLDGESGKVNSYVVYFYDTKNRLSTVEEFSIEDSLMNGRKYGYDEEGRINEIKYYQSLSSRVPALEKREVLAYYADTLKKSVVAYNPDRKKLYTYTFKYDSENKTNLTNMNFKVPVNNILKIRKKHILNNDDIVAEIQESIKYRNGNTANLRTCFEYDNQKRLISETRYREGLAESVFNYKYFANNQVHIIEEFDNNDVLVGYKNFDYLIYYINLGSNKSFLE